MVVVVSQAQRGPGLIDSGDQNIAAVLGQPASSNTNYILTALMRAADIADPTIIIHFTLALDGQVVRDEDWQCGSKDRNGNSLTPNYTYSTGAFVPTTVRVTANLPVRMSFGLDVTLGTVTA